DGDAGGDESDGQGDAAGVDDAAKDVAAILLGAHEMGLAGRLEAGVADVALAVGGGVRDGGENLLFDFSIASPFAVLRGDGVFGGSDGKDDEQGGDGEQCADQNCFYFKRRV